MSDHPMCLPRAGSIVLIESDCRSQLSLPPTMPVSCSPSAFDVLYYIPLHGFLPLDLSLFLLPLCSFSPLSLALHWSAVAMTLALPHMCTALFLFMQFAAFALIQTCPSSAFLGTIHPKRVCCSHCTVNWTPNSIYLSIIFHFSPMSPHFIPFSEHYASLDSTSTHIIPYLKVKTHAQNFSVYLFTVFVLLTKMPGSAFFYGPVACHNIRNIFSDKPKTFNFDAEIFLGPDEHNTTHVMMAVLHYYVPPNLPTPNKGHIYLTGGKLASVSGSTPVGEDYDASSYDAVIDATFVCLLFSESYFFTYFTHSFTSYQKLWTLFVPWLPLLVL